MGKKKIIFLCSFGLFFLLISTGFYLYFLNSKQSYLSLKELESKLELKNGTINENQSFSWKPDLFFDIPSLSSLFSQSQSPESQTPKERISATAKEILSLIKNEQPTIENQTLSEKKESFSKKPLTEEEIFEFIYPGYYRNYLNKMQELMIKDEFLKLEEKMAFKNENEIFAFLERGVDYWISIKVIDSNQKENYLKGLALLRALNEKEARYYRMGYLGKFLKLVSDWPNTFFKSSVLAVDCFRPGIPKPGGVNLWAPCCTCWFEEDPFGCLNAVCPHGPAIWDPMTGICGCG